MTRIEDKNKGQEERTRIEDKNTRQEYRTRIQNKNTHLFCFISVMMWKNGATGLYTARSQRTAAKKQSEDCRPNIMKDRRR